MNVVPLLGGLFLLVIAVAFVLMVTVVVLLPLEVPRVDRLDRLQAHRLQYVGALPVPSRMLLSIAVARGILLPLVLRLDEGHVEQATLLALVFHDARHGNKIHH